MRAQGSRSAWCADIGGRFTGTFRSHRSQLELISFVIGKTIKINIKLYVQLLDQPIIPCIQMYRRSAFLIIKIYIYGTGKFTIVFFAKWPEQIDLSFDDIQNCLHLIFEGSIFIQSRIHSPTISLSHRRKLGVIFLTLYIHLYWLHPEYLCDLIRCYIFKTPYTKI